MSVPRCSQDFVYHKLKSLRAGVGKKLESLYQAKAAAGEIKPEEMEAIHRRIQRVVIGNLTKAEVKERIRTIVGVPKEILDQAQGKKQTLDFDHWVCSRKELAAPSASVVINPQVPQIALIYCIHGLGLHGASFTKFGHAMADKGYPVLLPDIRGFGANANRKGLDLFEPNDSLKDINRTLIGLEELLSGPAGDYFR